MSWKCEIDILIYCFLEVPAPPKLLEIDDLPVENHDKDCHINPASRGAVPGDSMQSAGSTGKDLGKELKYANPNFVVD